MVPPDLRIFEFSGMVNRPFSFQPAGLACKHAQDLDGLSLAVNYVDGKLTEAITRGDGHVGENITPNAKRMQGVPHKLPNANPPRRRP